MKKITFNCEVITPMFMAGADGRNAELRPPSIKGLMRFWWRALKCDNNINNLKKEEYELFGGSSNEKQIKSSFDIRVLSSFDNKYLGNNLWDEINHTSETSRNGKKYNLPTPNSKGIQYLLYSMLLSPNERPYFKSGMPFDIIINSKNHDKLKQVLASLWASIYLGGFGSRSRRGGGNIIVTNIIDESNILKEIGLNFFPEGDNSVKAAGWLKNNFQTAQKIITNNKIGIASDYSNMSISRLIISQNSQNNWIKSLNDIGKIFADFRTNKRSQIFDTAVFGLPVRHKNGTVKGKLNNDKFERRMSPLIFKLLKAENKYYWIVIRLAGKFLPEGSVITAYKTQKPDYKLIDEFWNILREANTEHILSLSDKISKIKNDIINKYSPEKIILFGSKASGNFSERSDIDLAVKSEKNIETSNTKGVIDIIDFKRADERLKNKIEKDGVIIYERQS